MSESIQQQHVVAWFRAQYPGKIIFAIPNAQKLLSTARNKFAMQRLLAREGLTAGASDLFIAVPTRRHGGLFLEMKAEGSTYKALSIAQCEFMEQIREAGYDAQWAAGFEQAKSIIEDYMKGVQGL